MDDQQQPKTNDEVAASAETPTTPEVSGVTTEQPEAPVASVQEPQAPAVGEEATAAVKKSKKSKWLLPAVFSAVLLLGGGAAAYVTVFQKSPENLWKSALGNTAQGLDLYLKNASDAGQKGSAVDGKFKVTSPIALDGSFEGENYGSNGSMTANIGAAGARVSAEFRTLATAGSETPDIYMKVDGLDGIDSLISSFGGGSSEAGALADQFSSIDGQWFFLDHTILDQQAATAQGEGIPELKPEDMKKITDNMMVVMKDRMFSTQTDKAVFTIAEKVGKEDFEGTASYKMKVKVDKNNFKSFVTALKDAAKGTKLEELVKIGENKDKTLEEALNFDDLLSEIEKADFSKATADVWVEANGKYIRNVRIYPMEDKKDSNYLDIGMNYGKGGDVIPILIRATVDDSGSKGTLSFGFDINYKNGDAKLTLDADMDSSDTKVKITGELNMKGTSDEVKVEKPSDAKNIFELLGGLSGLGSDSELGVDDTFTESTLPSGIDYGDLPLDDALLQ